MVDFAEMSIENLTKASYVLFVISGVLAVSAVILFFSLNIPKCLRMVWGKYPVHRNSKQQKTGKIKKEKNKKRNSLQVFTGREETLPLGCVGGSECSSAEETLLLNYADIEQTEMLDTENLDMIQNIVMAEGEFKYDKYNI